MEINYMEYYTAMKGIIYELLLEENQNNIWKSWAIIKEVINKGKKKREKSNEFLINNEQSGQQ